MQTLCAHFSMRNNAKVLGSGFHNNRQNQTLLLLVSNENRANPLVFQKILYSFDALCFA
ncbi:hypothetical protein [Helicobacter pylori]|uniref:hypothetical protein n=1 Tax=Helicobacter pylori TaxID=210 RepID=UPI0030BCED25